jgi:hypothetical protein
MALADDAIRRAIDFLQQALLNQQTTLRFQVWLAFGLVGLGLGAITLGYFLAGSVIPDNLKWIPVLGGFFPPALTGFPLKEISNRRDKIAALNFLKGEFEGLQGSTVPVDTQHVERLQQQLNQFIDKLLGG